MPGLRNPTDSPWSTAHPAPRSCRGTGSDPSPDRTTFDNWPKRARILLKCRTASPVAVRHFLRPYRKVDSVSEPLVCSAKGCQEPAVWALVWNNPKLHTPDRRKSWLACDEHRAAAGRLPRGAGFLREVVPAEEAPDDPGPAALASASAADGRHRPVGLEEQRVVDPVARALAAIAATHRSAISSSVAPSRSGGAQVGLLAGEQAVAHLAVGGQPDPVAVAAERPCHRGDHADRRRAAVDEEQLGRRATPRLGRRASARTPSPGWRRSRRR